MHNKVWGSAEILANFVETIVFVNTLHPLPEAFLAFFLGLLLPPIQCALYTFWEILKLKRSIFCWQDFWSYKVLSLCLLHWIYYVISCWVINVKSITIFIVKVQSTTAETKKNIVKCYWIYKMFEDRCQIPFYKIIQIVRVLWLAIKPFYMSVCKHGFCSSFISYFIKEM